MAPLMRATCPSGKARTPRRVAPGGHHMRTKQIVGLIVLGCILASIGVLAGLIAWLGAAAGSVVGLLLAGGLIGMYVVLVGPWQRRWGATEEEVRRAMPGDSLLRPDAPSTTRAITIGVSPEAVFP